MSDPFVIAPLPVGLLEPGVYVSVRTDGDPGLSAPNNRCLLWGYRGSGTAPANIPFRALSQDGVDAAVGSSSMLANAFAAAKAQIPIGMECWLMPLDAPSGGTAQIVTVEIIGEPLAGVVSSATAAAAADTVYVKNRGRGVAISFKAGDDFSTIATAIKTAWDLVDNAPATCSRSGAVLSFTARHKGAVDWGGWEVTFASNGVSGVAAKCGTLTLSGTAGVATTGSLLITMMSKTATVAITDTETAAASATGVVNKILADSYPIRAAQAGSPDGVVVFYFVNGRPLRPLSISAALTGVTTQTAVVATGTAGAGVPTLTSALANLGASDDAYKAWSLFYTTTTELSATATHIEVEEGVSEGMKGQVAIFCLTSSLATLAANNVPTATTPRLDSSARYVPMWSQSAGNAGWEYSARLCAAVAAEAYVSRNWNFFEFVGSDSAPVVATHPADRPTRSERNEAIGLRHAPVTVNSSGNMALVWGGTCYKAKGFKDAKLTKLSARLTCDFLRTDVAQYLASLYSGKKMKGNAPRTSNAVDKVAVQGSVYRWTQRMDGLDILQNTEANREAILASVVVAPGRLDLNIPWDLLADLDQIAVVGIVS